MQLNQFEKRDMATTKNLSYDLKQTAKEIISPTTYAEGNTTVSKLQINHLSKDANNLYASMLPKEAIKPKGYNEYTKKCDMNYHKIGLRQ